MKIHQKRLGKKKSGVSSMYFCSRNSRRLFLSFIVVVFSEPSSPFLCPSSLWFAPSSPVAAVSSG